MIKNTLIVSLLLFAFTGCKEKLHSENVAVTIIAQGKMPAVASDTNNAVHLVYGSADKIMYTISVDKGQSFSSPELAGTLPGLVASATRGPQIAVTKNGIAIIAVNDSGNIFSYLKDRSGKWTRTGRVNDADTTDKEGFLGLSSDNENTLFAIWTDLRGDHHNKIFGARSDDGGKTWMKNILVYASPGGTVCECCKPSVIMNGTNVFVMFRNLLDGNRDLYLVRSPDKGESFGEAQKLGRGSWPLDGCPMDGGSLVVNTAGHIETVWRRRNALYVCEPGKDEKEIGKGRNCSIENVDGKNIYAWEDNEGMITCLLPAGAFKTIGKGKLPVLKTVGDNKVLCVWEDDTKIKSFLFSL